MALPLSSMFLLIKVSFKINHDFPDSFLLLIIKMNYRIFILAFTIFCLAAPITAGPRMPSVAQVICSAFCSPNGCSNFTSNDCNNNCNVAWGWIPLGTACALLNDRTMLDTSSDSGGTLLISPSTISSSCPYLADALNGLQPYGDFTASQTVTITKPSGTSLGHYAVDLIFNMILVDTNRSSFSLRWTTCQVSVKLSPNTVQTFPLPSTSPAVSFGDYCGDIDDLEKVYQVQLTFAHNSTNQDIIFQLSTTNSNPNSLWVAKEFIVTLRLCDPACLSCNSSSALNSCFACNVSLGYKLSNASCLSQCTLGFGDTNDAGKCVWCDLRCATCYQQPNNCSRCTRTAPWASSLIFDQTLGYFTCVETCPIGYFSSNGQCINITGCSAIYFRNETPICVRCNSVLKLTLLNNTCVCLQGYQFDDAENCEQICGDGRLFELQCDDGNTVDGDGCSSSCRLENLFKCYNGSKDHKSQCLYMGQIKITQTVSSKVEGFNQAQIILTLFPSLIISALPNFIDSLNFSCNSKSDLIRWQVKDNNVYLLVDYYQDLEGTEAEVQLILSSSLVKYKVLQSKFVIASSGGPKIVIIGNYNRILQFSLFFQIVSLCSLILFVVSSLTHKMIGVETLNAFQFIYFISLLEEETTEFYFSFRYLTYTNLNILFPRNLSNNYFQLESTLAYLSENQFWTKAIISITLCSPLIISFARITSSNWLSRERRVQIFNRICRFIYCSIWFPLSAGFLFEATALDKRTNGYMEIFLHVFVSLVYFYQWRFLFIKRMAGSYSNVTNASPKYVAVYLTFAMLMTLNIHLGNAKTITFAVQIEFLLIIALLVWFLKSKPYRNNIHNAGQVINLIMLLSFVIWSLCRSYFHRMFANQIFEIMAMLGMSILMTLSVIFATIRFVIEIRQNCRKKQAHIDRGRHPQGIDSPKEASFDKKEMILEQMQKYNRYCLDTIRMQTKFLQQNQFNLARATRANKPLNQLFPIDKLQMQRRISKEVNDVFKTDHGRSGRLKEALVDKAQQFSFMDDFMYSQ